MAETFSNCKAERSAKRAWSLLVFWPMREPKLLMAMAMRGLKTKTTKVICQSRQNIHTKQPTTIKKFLVNSESRLKTPEAVMTSVVERERTSPERMRSKKGTGRRCRELKTWSLIRL